MKNIILMIIAAFVMSVAFNSCVGMEGLVVTTPDQLVEGEEAPQIPWDFLSDELKAKIPEGTIFVLAEKEQLKPDATYVSLDAELTDGEAQDWVHAGLGVASAFIPGLAAWEGVLTLFSKRKRQHYTKAIKSATPYDGKVDFGQAVNSLVSALGASHSSKGTEELNEKERAKAV